MGPKDRQFRIYGTKDTSDGVIAERMMVDNDGMAMFFRGGQAFVWIAPGAWTWIVDEGPVEEEPQASE